MNQYYDYIIKELSAGISRKDVYYRLVQKGYKGKLTAAYDYMNRIIKSHPIDIAIYRSSTAESMQKKKEIQKYDHITRRFQMTDFIATPTMGAILLEEFMEPMSISAYKLAQEIHVPVSRIQDILHDRRKITADTSLRLAKFFGVSDKYFLDMQNDIDIRNLKVSLADDIAKIRVCQAV